jgi:hypothetical protein
MKLSMVYKFRILQLQIQRTIHNFFTKFANEKIVETFPYAIKRHQSLLRRKLGSSDPMLQENKITNLSIALKSIDGIVLNPGINLNDLHDVNAIFVRLIIVGMCVVEILLTTQLDVQHSQKFHHLTEFQSGYSTLY